MSPYITWGRAARMDADQLVPGPAFRFPLRCEHLLLTGKTRSGKSSAAAAIVAGLPKDVACIVIDSENDKVWQNIAIQNNFNVLNYRDFRRNPCAGRDGSWFSKFKRNFRESYRIGDGGQAMLTTVWVLCEAEGGIITLRRLDQKLKAQRYRLGQGREFGYFESLKNRFSALIENEIHDCETGYDLHLLTSGKLLIMCDGIGDEEFVFFVNDLLLAIADQCEPGLASSPRLVVVIEELHRLTNRERLRRADVGEPVLVDAVKSLAKRAVSLVMVDQCPSELPNSILANIGFRAIFVTDEGRELDALQRSLNLNHEQRVFLSRLPRRACIVRYSNPRFPEPFPVLLDELELRDDVAHEIEVKRRETLASLTWTPTRALEPPVERARETTPALSKDVLDYLAEIAKNQLLPASRRDSALKIPISQGNALRAGLVDAGLVSLERVNTYGRSKTITNTRITEAGYKLLESMKVPFERPRGKGGPEHQYHQYSVAQWAKRNARHAVIEHFYDGKSVDVALDGRIAVEILCEGVQKELANLRDLAVGYEELWFAVADRQRGEQLRRHIVLQFGDEAAEILSRTQFKLLGEFQEPPKRDA